MESSISIAHSVEQFFQDSPHKTCKINRPSHADPRCSLACRYRWARKEAETTLRTLSELPKEWKVYFGTIVPLEALITAEHKQARRLFLEALHLWAEGIGATAKIRVASEVGDKGCIHYHYCLYSSFPIEQETVKQWWQSACIKQTAISTTGQSVVESSVIKSSVQHGEARKGNRAAVRYMFKHLIRYKHGNGFIRLFRPGTLPLTWGSRASRYGQGFHARSVVTLWNECLHEWYPKARVCPTDRSFFNGEDEANGGMPVSKVRTPLVRSRVRTLHVF